jgi:hypothetical protein
LHILPESHTVKTEKTLHILKQSQSFKTQTQLICLYLPAIIRNLNDCIYLSHRSLWNVNKEITVELTTDRLPISSKDPICKTQKTNYLSYITNTPVHLLHLIQWRVQK